MPNESTMSSDLAKLLQEADEEFVARCQERLAIGQERYGEMAFLGVDTIEEAMQEVLDLSNYARFTYIKLYLLHRAATHHANRHPAADTQGFISLKELFKS